MNSIATIKSDYLDCTKLVTNNGKQSPSLSLSLVGTSGSAESATIKEGIDDGRGSNGRRRFGGSCTAICSARRISSR